MAEAIMIIALVGLLVSALIRRIADDASKYEMDKLDKQMKIDKLEREVEALKGFPLVKAEEIKTGEMVSNADSIYLCLDMKSPNYEKIFFNLNSKKLISISYNEKVRRRKDLETAIYKMLGVN